MHMRCSHHAHAVSDVRRLRKASPAPFSSSRRCLLLGRESPGTADDCPSSTAPSPTDPAVKPEAAGTLFAPSMSISRRAALVFSCLAAYPPAPLAFALFLPSPALICRLGPRSESGSGTLVHSLRVWRQNIFVNAHQVHHQLQLYIDGRQCTCS